MIKKAQKKGFLLIGIIFGIMFSYFSLSAIFHEKQKHQPYRKYHDIRPQRHKVQKDLFLSGQSKRPHISITSDLSDLIFIQRNKRIDCMEKLENISCTQMDEQMQHFTAKRGTYYFLLHRFLAEDLTIDFFHLQKDTPSFLQGTAKKASFSLDRSALSFDAEDFQATMEVKKD